MTSRRAWAGILASLLLGLFLRLVPYGEVFGDGLHLVMDGDPWYHVLRAQELARTGRIPWVDPAINAPVGAEVPWPPLFDALLAASGWIAGGGSASDASIALAATAVPVVLGLALIAFLALLAARAFGPGVAVVAAFCAAAFGWHVDVGLVGRPDQHVAELLLLAALLVLLVAAVAAPDRAARRSRALGAGLVLCLAFWTWLGSALSIVLLAATWCGWHLAARRDDPLRAEAHTALLWTGTTAGVLLLASVGWLGPEGALRRGGLAGMSALPAALCLVLAAMAAVLRRFALRRPAAAPAARALEVGVAGVLGLLLLWSFGPLRTGLVQGLTALGRTNPWYAHIREFQPIVGSGFAPMGSEVRTALGQLGFLPLVAVAGAAAVPSLVRERPERRFGAFVVVAGFALFLPLALVRARFGPYLGIFAAPLAGVAAWWGSRRFAAASWRWAIPAAVVALSVGPCAAYAVTASRRVPVLDAALALGRVAGERARAEGPGGTGTVLSTWSAGHHLRAGSGLPVLMTPFGSEGGEGALEDGFAWFVARSDTDAAAVETRRGARWIVLSDPIPEVALGPAVLGSDPTAGPARLVRDVHEGIGIELSPTIEEVVSVRLFYSDGSATPGARALSRYRLVDEIDAEGRPLAKLFEIVPGARVGVTGAAPGAPVVVEVVGLVNGARPFHWGAMASADPSGAAELDVPYSTERTSALDVRSVRVSSGRASVVIELPERAVTRGELVRVALPAPSP